MTCCPCLRKQKRKTKIITILLYLKNILKFRRRTIRFSSLWVLVGALLCCCQEQILIYTLKCPLVVVAGNNHQGQLFVGGKKNHYLTTIYFSKNHITRTWVYIAPLARLCTKIMTYAQKNKLKKVIAWILGCLEIKWGSAASFVWFCSTT